MVRKRALKGEVTGSVEAASEAPKLDNPEVLRNAQDLEEAGNIDLNDALNALGLSANYTMAEADRALGEIMQSAEGGTVRYRAVQSYRRLEAEVLAGIADRTGDQPPSDQTGEARRTDLAEQDDADRKLDRLIKEAEAGYAGLAAFEAARTSAAERAAFQPIAATLAVIHMLLDDDSLRERYCAERGLTQDGRSSRNPLHALVKGLFPKAQWNPRKGLISKHADVIFALKEASVRPDEVVHWLNEPDQNVGDGATGYKKAEAALRASPAWTALKKKAEQARQTEQNSHGDNLLQELKEQLPFHEIEEIASTDRPPDGLAILAAYISNGRMKLHLLTTERKKAIKTIDALKREPKPHLGKIDDSAQKERGSTP